MDKKILVVDDDKKILMVIEKRLTSAGYEVITADEGIVGLKKARSENPDLIILDLILPGINGFQICSLLKKDPKYCSIPIIMLTGLTEEREKEIGGALGADAYFTKPFKHQELLEKISELLTSK